MKQKGVNSSRKNTRHPLYWKIFAQTYVGGFVLIGDMMFLQQEKKIKLLLALQSHPGHLYTTLGPRADYFLASLKILMVALNHKIQPRLIPPSEYRCFKRARRKVK